MPAAPILSAPRSQRLIKIFKNEKDVGAVLFAYPDFVGSGKPFYARISNQLAHVMRYYIRVQHLIIYNNI